MPEPQWQVQPVAELPTAFVQAVNQCAAGLSGYAAQLLWQRGIQDPKQVAGFVNPDLHQPTSPFEFGQEMHRAVERLRQAYEQGEAIAIWGDFDADGITATAVLWDGLGQFFPQDKQLTYFIPNRLTESHGLSIHGIDALAAQNCHLIVTCDTGSTNLPELEAQLEAVQRERPKLDARLERERTDHEVREHLLASARTSLSTLSKQLARARTSASEPDRWPR
ncbi:MAG: hypothetical protein HC840_32035, partial [Leptolyngbyaceae cyanobacterium RM2_2_4]|nr:hypothetical protein [Leptolyngbyaceae cyanobacterium RM2_2_4]